MFLWRPQTSMGTMEDTRLLLGQPSSPSAPVPAGSVSSASAMLLLSWLASGSRGSLRVSALPAQRKAAGVSCATTCVGCGMLFFQTFHSSVTGSTWEGGEWAAGVRGSSAGGGGMSGHYSEAKAEGGGLGFLLFTVWRSLDHILVFTGSFPFPTPSPVPSGVPTAT